MRKKSKIDRYIESRLWKVKMSGRPSIPTRVLIGEIERYYLGGKKLKDNPVLNRQMEGIIRRARNRVNRKWSRMRKQRSLWAKKLGVSESTVDLLVKERLIANARDVSKQIRFMEILNLSHPEAG